jgi:hypothetical protein
MDINIFDDPNKVPQPRENIRIEDLSATPHNDRFRVHVEVSVTPFRERPNLLLVLQNAAGDVVSELNIIETMHADMEFTIHVRGVDDPAGDYMLTAELFYETRNPPQDKRSVSLSISDA